MRAEAKGLRERFEVPRDLIDEKKTTEMSDGVFVAAAVCIALIQGVEDPLRIGKRASCWR